MSYSLVFSISSVFSKNFIPIIYACMLSHFSHVRLCATLWTVACQIPLSMGLSRPEYWSGLPCFSAGDLPNSGIKPEFLTSPVLADGFVITSNT